MGERSAPHLDFAGEVRAETRLPTFHAARIQDVATARYAIASGKLDMVGMTRAHMADPHIARKIAEGREAEIRPCVGMGYCIDFIYAGQAVCIHNPSTGREATIPHLVPRSNGPKRKVVVVGAGPGGLEAARVAGERGHNVVVLEAAARPGGQIVSPPRSSAGVKSSASSTGGCANANDSGSPFASTLSRAQTTCSASIRTSSSSPPEARRTSSSSTSAANLR